MYFDARSIFVIIGFSVAQSCLNEALCICGSEVSQSIGAAPRAGHQAGRATEARVLLGFIFKKHHTSGVPSAMGDRLRTFNNGDGIVGFGEYIGGGWIHTATATAIERHTIEHNI